MALRSFADGALFAESTGTGRPGVVLLHGWGRDRHDFDRMLPQLPRPALAFDLPGFGASPPPPAAWGASEYARLLAGALDGAATGGPVDPVIVVGHSFGGRVAACLAAQRPDLVFALVLTGVPLLRPEQTRRRPALAFRLGRTLHRRGLLGEARMEALRQRYGSADYRAASGVMREVLVRVVGESYEDELGRLACPVSLVWGADDTAAPAEMARRACAMIASCTLEVVEAVGHDVHLDRPDLVVAGIAALAGGAPR